MGSHGVNCAKNEVFTDYRYTNLVPADTKSNDTVLECQNFFDFLPVSQPIAIRTSRFLDPFICSENLLCNVFKRQALCHKSEINLGY